MVNLERQQWSPEALRLATAHGATIPTGETLPILWWSHRPAGWCLNTDLGVEPVGKEWSQTSVSGRTVWFAPVITAVVVSVRSSWFIETGSGRERLTAYRSGARKSIQYAAKVHGLETPQQIVTISTSRPTKSRALYEDVVQVQRSINAAFGRPAPLWTTWVMLGAITDANGQPVVFRLVQGAEVSPPRVLRAGWTKEENWPTFAKLATQVAGWGSDTVIESDDHDDE